MAADQIGHWVDVLNDITDSEPNVPFAARSFARGAATQLRQAETAINAALSTISAGGRPRDLSVPAAEPQPAATNPRIDNETGDQLHPTGDWVVTQ